MAPSDKPVEATLVSCKVCLEEIPKSEATVPEAVDYFVYFCGPDCYEKWKNDRRPPEEQVEPRGRPPGIVWYLKAMRMVVVAVVIVASGLVLHVARAQQAGIKRIDLQRHDLSVPGREVVQVIVELDPGVTSSRHTHPGEEIVYVLEGAPLEYRGRRKAAGDAQAGRCPLHPGRNDPRGEERRQPKRSGAGHVYRRKRKTAPHRGQ